jgi:hypothetical protein
MGGTAMDEQLDPSFTHVLADGYGLQGRQAVELVFVDAHPGDAFGSAVRVGILARLLGSDVDWDEAAEAAGFTVQARPRLGSGGAGLRVEFGDGASTTLDLFDLAADPIGAVIRMVEDTGRRLS